MTEGVLENPGQAEAFANAHYFNPDANPHHVRPFLPTFDRVFLTYDNTTVTAWVAAP